MFYEFLNDYEKIYTGFLRKLKWFEIIWIIVWIFLYIFTIFLRFNESSNYLVIISGIVTLLTIIGLIIYINYINKKADNDRPNMYKEDLINKLIVLINNDKYNLYSINGIQWIIDSSTLYADKKKFPYWNILNPTFSKVFIPIATFCVGTLAKTMNTNEIINSSIYLVISLVLLLFTVLLISPVIQFIIYPNRIIVETLQEDLKYIQTQISENLIKKRHGLRKYKV